MSDEKKAAVQRIRIIKSMMINNPILRYLGIIFERILLIRVEQGNINNLIRLLTEGKNAKIMDDERIGKDLRGLFENPTGFLIYRFTATRKSTELVERLFSLEIGGDIHNYYWPLVIIVTDNPYVLQDNDKFYEIFLPGDFKETSLADTYVIPPDGTIPLIIKRIQEMSSETTEQHAFMAASEFLFPLVSEAEYSEIKKEAGQLGIEDRDSFNPKEVMEVFLDRLQEWAEVTTAIVRELPIICEEEIRNKHVLFYDEDFIYLSQEVFTEIVTPLLGQINIGKLKRCLVESHLLVPESGNVKTYTVKMSYEDVDGGKKRSRMLRFSRELLDANNSDLKVVDFLLIKEERGI